MTDQPIPPADEQVLEPCPFCGVEADEPFENERHYNDGWWDIRCSSCDASITGNWSKEAAITAWNQRTRPPVVDGLSASKAIEGHRKPESAGSREPANLPKPTEQATSPAPDAVLREEWLTPEAEPPMGRFNSRNFIVAVKRAYSGRVYVFPAQYLFNCPLWFEDEAEERAVTGWYGADCESDEITNYTPLLSNGDELMGWQPLPEWNALASPASTAEGEAK